MINFATLAQRKVRKAAGLPPFPLVLAEQWLILCCRANGRPRARFDGKWVTLSWKNGTVVTMGAH